MPPRHKKKDAHHGTPTEKGKGLELLGDKSELVNSEQRVTEIGNSYIRVSLNVHER
jgi:hypothetical protein